MCATMVLGAKSTHVTSEIGRGMSRGSSTMLPYSTKKRKIIPMTAEDSVAEFKRDRSNVRPYVRSSTSKLKWTRELHQSFMRAINRLGGKEKATPKRILEHMDKDGITIAHIKSHLQMYRTGKINAEGLPTTVTFSSEADPPKDIKSNPKEFSEISPKEAHEVYTAFQFLKEGRFSGAAGAETRPKGLADIPAIKPSPPEKKDVKTHEFVARVEPRRSSPSPPRLEAFFDDVGVTDVRGRKRRAEDDVELALTMATRSSSPRILFPCPSTPEEATLSLGLSS